MSKANLVDDPITRLHTISRSNSTQAITSIRQFGRLKMIPRIS